MSWRIEWRRDTAANWTAANPVLLAGEPGFETDTQKFKIGDGATAWTSLTYAMAGSLVFNIKDYGAKVDGTTDDYNAIVAADAAAAAVDGIVFFPPASTKARTSKPLTPSANAVWAGASMWASGLTVLPADYGNFVHLYVINCTNANVQVRDLGIDGQKRNGSNPVNECGGVQLGPGTVLERVRVDDPNYFGIWVSATAADARVIDCRSARGGNNDSIGGGGGTDVLIVRHVWESTLVGNRFDNVNGTHVVLDSCVDLSANAGGVFFEGMTRSGARNCRFTGTISGLTIQSDAGYSPATVTNPLECFAHDNYVKGAPIQLSYNQTIASVNKGGYNTIRGNLVDQAPTWGILLLQGGSVTYSYGHDAIVGNTVRNPNSTNVTTANDGINTVYVGAVVCDNAGVTLVQGNRTIDEWSPARTQMPVTTLGGGTYHLYGNDFGPSQFGVDPQGGAVVYARSNAGWNPQGHIASPAIPASGTAYTNVGPADYTVTVSGGTVSAVAIGGTATGLTSGTFRVPCGQTITLTYTAAPTWNWYGD